MKLKEYKQLIDNLAKEKPESLEMDVIYSGDDEGNYFGNVFYSPSVMDHEGTEKVCLN